MGLSWAHKDSDLGTHTRALEGLGALQLNLEGHRSVPTNQLSRCTKKRGIGSEGEISK